MINPKLKAVSTGTDTRDTHIRIRTWSEGLDGGSSGKDDVAVELVEVLTDITHRGGCLVF